MDRPSVQSAILLVLMTVTLPAVTSLPVFLPLQPDLYGPGESQFHGNGGARDRAYLFNHKPMATEKISLRLLTTKRADIRDDENTPSTESSPELSKRMETLQGILSLIHRELVAVGEARQKWIQPRVAVSNKRGPRSGPSSHFLRIGRGGASTDVTASDVLPFSATQRDVDSYDKGVSALYDSEDINNKGGFHVYDSAQNFEKGLSDMYDSAQNFEKGLSDMYDSVDSDNEGRSMYDSTDNVNGFSSVRDSARAQTDNTLEGFTPWNEQGNEDPYDYTTGVDYVYPRRNSYAKSARASPSSDFFSRSTRVFRTPHNHFLRIGRALSPPSARLFRQTKRLSPMNRFVRIGRSFPNNPAETKSLLKNHLVRIVRSSDTTNENHEQALNLNPPHFVQISHNGDTDEGEEQATSTNEATFVRLSRSANTEEDGRSRYLSQVLRAHPGSYVRIGRLPASVFLRRQAMQDGGDTSENGRRTRGFRLTRSGITRAGKRGSN